MSDDGKFIHRLTSPRHHVPKVYEVQLKHAIDSSQISRLLGEGTLTEQALSELQDAVHAEIDAAVRQAQSAPYPAPDALCTDVYA